MFDFLRKKLTRRDGSHPPDVEEAEQKQKRQFDEWGTVMKEMRRVEDVVAGREKHK